jgi:hypothetical protein
MTFGAIGHAFQVGVEFGEFAGRDLGSDLTIEEQIQKKKTENMSDNHSHLCFSIASPNFFVICIPAFFKNSVGSSPPAKI